MRQKSTTIDLVDNFPNFFNSDEKNKIFVIKKKIKKIKIPQLSHENSVKIYRIRKRNCFKNERKIFKYIVEGNDSLMSSGCVVGAINLSCFVQEKNLYRISE